MNDYIDRMKKERNELKDKYEKLGSFIFGEETEFNNLDKTNQALLMEQLTHMKGYLTTLDTRLHISHK